MNTTTKTSKLQSTVESFRREGFGIYRRIPGTLDASEVRRMKSLHPEISEYYHNYVDDNAVRNAIRELRARYSPMVAIIDITAVDDCALESIIMYNHAPQTGYKQIHVIE